MNQNTEYKLGRMVGDIIVYRFLPTFTLDHPYGNNTIDMSVEDTINYEKVQDEATKYYGVDEYHHNINWSKYQTLRKELKQKYFPHVLETYIDIEIEDINDIKSGIRESLWQSDICEYNIELENILIEHEWFNDNFFQTKISFKLD